MPENRFSNIQLVAANMVAKEDVIVMDNGCLCCTVRGDLIRVLSDILDRDERFDGVIIETTGLADPAPVAFTFNHPSVKDLYRCEIRIGEA